MGKDKAMENMNECIDKLLISILAKTDRLYTVADMQASIDDVNGRRLREEAKESRESIYHTVATIQYLMMDEEDYDLETKDEREVLKYYEKT